MSRWNPWADAAQLRAENSSLKRKLAEATRHFEHERNARRVFESANHELIRESHKLDCELKATKAAMREMHRRDPETGRLLPKGR